MVIFFQTKKKRNSARRIISAFVAFGFAFNCIIPPQFIYAQTIQNVLNLPAPGTMVGVSPVFTPPLIRGVTVYPDNPFKFNFIVDSGDDRLAGADLEKESNKLVRYFMAALTVPENELWVNLSPYERSRIVPESFAKTEMGRDLLAQDYLLKQLTSSLMFPDDELGKKFWDRVHAKVQEKFGTANVPTNTFNKIWIVPEKAVIYQHESTAFVVESHLKVMLEEDYLAKQKELDNQKYPKIDAGTVESISEVSRQIIREVLIPEIEKEVNEGKNFAALRQIYNSVILASWYKKNLKESLLGQIYIGQNKTKGMEIADPQIKNKIYDQYVEAFKKGVYNYIKEDYDAATQTVIPRQYFSGGADLAMLGAKDGKDKLVESGTFTELRQIAEGRDFHNVGVEARNDKGEPINFVVGAGSAATSVIENAIEGELMALAEESNHLPATLKDNVSMSIGWRGRHGPLMEELIHLRDSAIAMPIGRLSLEESTAVAGFIRGVNGFIKKLELASGTKAGADQAMIAQGEKTAATVTDEDFRELLALRASGQAGFQHNVDSRKAIPAPASAVLDWTSVPDAEKQRLEEKEKAMYRSGKIAALVMIGGEATRFGGPKTFVEVSPELGEFLEIKAANNRWQNQTFGTNVPMYLLSSEKRLNEFKTALGERNFYGLSPDAYQFFTQGTVDTFIPTDEEIEANFKGADVDKYKAFARKMREENPDGIYRFQGERRKIPAGHFDALASFIISGRFSEALARGIEYISVFNIDNLQAVLKNDGRMAHFAESGKDFSFTLAEKNITYTIEYPDTLRKDKVIVRFRDNVISFNGIDEFEGEAEKDGLRFVINHERKQVDVFDIKTNKKLDIRVSPPKPDTGGTLVQLVDENNQPVGDPTMKEGFELRKDFDHVNAPFFNTNTQDWNLKKILRFLGVSQKELAAMSFEERSTLVRERLVKQTKPNFEFKDHTVDGEYPELGVVKDGKTKIPVSQLTRIILQVAHLKDPQGNPAQVEYYFFPRKEVFAPVKEPEDKIVAATNNRESLRDVTIYPPDRAMLSDESSSVLETLGSDSSIDQVLLANDPVAAIKGAMAKLDAQITEIKEGRQESADVWQEIKDLEHRKEHYRRYIQQITSDAAMLGEFTPEMAIPILQGSQAQKTVKVTLPLGLRAVKEEGTPVAITEAIRQAQAAINEGAQELEVVLNYWAIDDNNSAQAEKELSAFADGVKAFMEKNHPSRKPIVIKTVIETGAYKNNLDKLREAIHIALRHSDFLKISTEKNEQVKGTTLFAAREILLATGKYYQETKDKTKIGVRRGFEISGVVKVWDNPMNKEDIYPDQQAKAYMNLAYLVMKNYLGKQGAQDYVTDPTTFRIGASSLLDDLLEQIGNDKAMLVLKTDISPRDFLTGLDNIIREGIKTERPERLSGMDKGSFITELRKKLGDEGLVKYGIPAVTFKDLKISESILEEGRLKSFLRDKYQLKNEAVIESVNQKAVQFITDNTVKTDRAMLAGNEEKTAELTARLNAIQEDIASASGLVDQIAARHGFPNASMVANQAGWPDKDKSQFDELKETLASLVKSRNRISDQLARLNFPSRKDDKAMLSYNEVVERVKTELDKPYGQSSIRIYGKETARFVEFLKQAGIAGIVAPLVHMPQEDEKIIKVYQHPLFTKMEFKSSSPLRSVIYALLDQNDLGGFYKNDNPSQEGQYTPISVEDFWFGKEHQRELLEQYLEADAAMLTNEIPTKKEISLPEWANEFISTHQNGVYRTPEERMQVAIELSRLNVEHETGGPFGAAVFNLETGQLVSVGVNRVVPEKASIAHGEIMALIMAQERIGNFTVDQEGKGFELATSAEPCAMCVGAIAWSGVKSVITGATGRDVESITGFDEGPIHPQWEDQLEKRNISVEWGVLRDEAVRVLNAYKEKGGKIYNANADRTPLAKNSSQGPDAAMLVNEETLLLLKVRREELDAAMHKGYATQEELFSARNELEGINNEIARLQSDHAMLGRWVAFDRSQEAFGKAIEIARVHAEHFLPFRLTVFIKYRDVLERSAPVEDVILADVRQNDYVNRLEKRLETILSRFPDKDNLETMVIAHPSAITIKFRKVKDTEDAAMLGKIQTAILAGLLSTVLGTEVKAKVEKTLQTQNEQVTQENTLLKKAQDRVILYKKQLDAARAESSKDKKIFVYSVILRGISRDIAFIESGIFPNLTEVLPALKKIRDTAIEERASVIGTPEGPDLRTASLERKDGKDAAMLGNAKQITEEIRAIEIILKNLNAQGGFPKDELLSGRNVRGNFELEYGYVLVTKKDVRGKKKDSSLYQRLETIAQQLAKDNRGYIIFDKEADDNAEIGFVFNDERIRPQHAHPEAMAVAKEMGSQLYDLKEKLEERLELLRQSVKTYHGELGEDRQTVETELQAIKIILKNLNADKGLPKEGDFHWHGAATLRQEYILVSKKDFNNDYQSSLYRHLMAVAQRLVTKQGGYLQFNPEEGTDAEVLFSSEAFDNQGTNPRNVFRNMELQLFGFEQKLRKRLSALEKTSTGDRAMLSIEQRLRPQQAIGLIDLTVLERGPNNEPFTPELTAKLEKLFIDARDNCTGGTCTYFDQLVEENLAQLRGTNVKPAVVTNFPLGFGATSVEESIEQAKSAIAHGAKELDPVINYKAIIDGNRDLAEQQMMDYAFGVRKYEGIEVENSSIDQVLERVQIKTDRVWIKTILEAGAYETREQLKQASLIALPYSDMLKTGTGKNEDAGPATLKYTEVMVEAIGEYYLKTGILKGIKIAGGLKDWDDSADPGLSKDAQIKEYMLLIYRKLLPYVAKRRMMENPTLSSSQSKKAAAEITYDYITNPQYIRFGASSALKKVVEAVERAGQSDEAMLVDEDVNPLLDEMETLIQNELSIDNVIGKLEKQGRKDLSAYLIHSLHEYPNALREITKYLDSVRKVINGLEGSQKTVPLFTANNFLINPLVNIISGKQLRRLHDGDRIIELQAVTAAAADLGYKNAKQIFQQAAAIERYFQNRPVIVSKKDEAMLSKGTLKGAAATLAVMAATATPAGINAGSRESEEDFRAGISKKLAEELTQQDEDLLRLSAVTIHWARARLKVNPDKKDYYDHVLYEARQRQYDVMRRIQSNHGYITIRYNEDGEFYFIAEEGVKISEKLAGKLTEKEKSSLIQAGISVQFKNPYDQGGEFAKTLRQDQADLMEKIGNKHQIKIRYDDAKGSYQLAEEVSDKAMLSTTISERLAEKLSPTEQFELHEVASRKAKAALGLATAKSLAAQKVYELQLTQANSAQEILMKTLGSDREISIRYKNDKGYILAEEDTKGGIDLDPNMINLEIKHNGKGMPMAVPVSIPQNLHIEGLIPVIINITPVTNLPLQLGISEGHEVFNVSKLD